MKALLIALSLCISIGVAQANTAKDYALSKGQTLIVEYEGCSGEKAWMMNGVPMNWLAAQRGTPPNFPVWVVAVTPQEVEDVLTEWFRDMPIITTTAKVPSKWCEEGGIELKREESY